LALYARALGLSLDPRGRWRIYLPIAILNSAVPFVLIAAAQRELAASYTVILVSTTPLFAALIAAVALKDPLTPGKLTGLLLGIAGVALLIGWNPTALDVPPLWAIAAVLAAALFYAVAGVYTRMVAHGIPPIATAAGSQLAAALLVLPFVAAVPPSAMPTPLEWLNVVALALASSALAFILYYQLIRNIGPVKASTVNFLTPIFGVGGGALLLGERITANMLAGAAVILVGTALVLGGARPRTE
jgi:drug/metabolite transporter (DMT)-like permease